MTDKNYPKIFQTEYSKRESIPQIMKRTGLSYDEVSKYIVFWMVEGFQYGIRLRSENQKLWIENAEQK